MRVQPVVEGYGDVRAVPVLLRRLQEESQAYGLYFGRPIRRKRAELIQERSLRQTIRLALLQPECKAILIIFDADDDCPKELAPTLEKWAADEAGGVPCAVVIACREYEAWFLAALDSLRGKGRIRRDAIAPPNPEAPRGAKEKLEEYMEPGATYDETTDQPRLTASFDLAAAYRHCRSFRKMTKAFGVLASGVGAILSDWPPSTWSEGG